MAIGSFSNLAPAQLQLAQSRQASGDLLGNILQSLQTGAALGNFPQQIQQDRLTQQLKNAIMSQQLQDLQNPQAALARKLTQELTLKGALNPELGIRAAEPGLLGQTIGTPSAIGQTEDQLNAAIAANPNLAIPTAAVGSPETPISVFGINTGLTSNPNIPINSQQRKQSAEIAKIEARYKAAGVPTRRSVDADGNVSVVPTRMFDGVAPIATQVLDKDGKPLKEPPKAGKAGTGGLTEGQKLSAFNKASAAGLDPEDPRYLNEDTQTPDFVKLVIDTGKATRENKRLEDASKASGLSAKVQADIKALNAAEQQLEFLQNEIEQVAKSGKIPSFWDNMIAAQTAAPARGAISAGVQQLLKGVQSEESKELEGRKSIISSALTKAISGLAVTLSEDQRLAFLPRPGDSFEELIRKTGLVQSYIDNQRAGLRSPAEQAASSSVGTSGINPNAQAPLKIGRFTVTPN